jgi:hypothetical protein
MQRSSPTRAALVALVALAAMFAPPHRLGSAGRPTTRAAALRAARVPPASTGNEDDADAQAEMEFLMLRDPRANAIPRDIHRREIAFARALPQRRAGLHADATPAWVWTERGPNNVGGRTRAFAVDVSSPTTLFAGSVAGGIWRSQDDGATWSQRLSPAQIHGTTCIAQDRRAGHTGVWYVGTGEIRGSTTNATRWGANYVGDGIFKSSDGGSSWTLLPSTSTGTPQTADAFDYVIDVATNPRTRARTRCWPRPGRASTARSTAGDRGVRCCPPIPRSPRWRSRRAGRCTPSRASRGSSRCGAR